MAKLTTQEEERLNTWTAVIAQTLRPDDPVRQDASGSLRLGNKGSLSVSHRAGMWFDFVAGKGGVTAHTLRARVEPGGRPLTGAARAVRAGGAV